jgi:hypothetical protein
MPFQKATDEGKKPVPVMTSEVVGEPASTVAGVTAVIAGAGLSTLKLTAAELPPAGAGLLAMIEAIAAEAKSAAGTAAVILELPRNVVDKAAPFQEITEDAVKPVPETVSVVAAAPARALGGVMAVIVGTGLFTIN